MSFSKKLARFALSGALAMSMVLPNSLAVFQAKVNADSLYLRQSPGGAVITTLSKGTTVAVLNNSSSWYKVSVNGKEGYVSGEYLTGTTATNVALGTGTVKCSSSVNFRSAPNTSSTSYGELKNGTAVTVLSTSNGWSKVSYAGTTGYISADYLVTASSGTAINLDFAGAYTQEVARCGAVVSEFAPNMSVPRFGFRLRNRITSGLAVATVVVEAPEKSGALLFADDAVTQGREVFAVPGNADSRASAGSNALLKDGARPATCAWDVLSDFRRMFPGTLRENIAPAPETQAPEPPPETGSGFAQVRRPVAEKRIDKPQPEAYIDLEAQLKSLTTEQLQIVAAIDAPGTQVDLIIEKTQLPASKVLAELTVLQIRGVVRQEPGKRFSLNIRAGTAQNHKELE